jgi:hypothetical protein
MLKSASLLLCLFWVQLLGAQTLTTNYKIPLNLSSNESQIRLSATFLEEGHLLVAGSRVIREVKLSNGANKGGESLIISWFKIISKEGYQEKHYNFLPKMNFTEILDIEQVDSNKFLLFGKEVSSKKRKKSKNFVALYSNKGELSEKIYTPKASNTIIGKSAHEFSLFNNPVDQNGPTTISKLNCFDRTGKSLQKKVFVFTDKQQFNMLYDGIYSKKGIYFLSGFENTKQKSFHEDCKKIIIAADESGQVLWKHVFEKYFYIKHVYPLSETSGNSLLIADYAPKDSGLVVTSLAIENGKKKWEKLINCQNASVAWIQELEDQSLLIVMKEYQEGTKVYRVLRISPQNGQLLQDFVLPIENTASIHDMDLLSLRQKSANTVELVFSYSIYSTIKSLSYEDYLLSIDLDLEGATKEK